MLNTLVHNMSIHKGSQWAVLKTTVVFLYDYKGDPLYTLELESILVFNTLAFNPRNN